MISNKNIVDVIFADISYIGGIETGTRRRLLYLKNKGYDVVSICFEPKQRSILTDFHLDTEIRFIFLYNIRSLILSRIVNISLSCTHLIDLRLRGKFSTFHCHDLYSGFAGAIIKTLFPGIFLAVTWHGPASYELIFFRKKDRVFSDDKIKIKYRLAKKIYLLMENFVCKKADLVMGVSEFEKEYFEEAFGIKNIVIVRNGVDTEKFSPMVAQLPEAPRGKTIITYVGRLVKKNSPDILVHAVPYLKKRSEDLHVLIVGAGELESGLKQFVRENSLEEDVSFLGKRYDIDVILNSSDIFVSHCSSLVDGIGNNVIEAIASGKPCIVGNDKINSSIFTNRENGILVQKDNPEMLADEIIHLVENPELCRKISTNARKLALEEFSIERNLKKLELLLFRENS